MRNQRLVNFVRATVVVALAVCATALVAATDVTADVQRVGSELHTDVALFVPAPPSLVWEVITDYDHATSYVSDLEESRIVSRTPDVLRVFQRAKVKYGPISLTVETLRDVQLIGTTKTHSILVKGTMEKHEAITEISPVEGGTRITYRATSVPGSYLLALIGQSFVKREAEEKFSELRDEILRRKRARGIS